MEKIYDGVVCSGRIFSFHWLRDYQFITCSTDGCLETWNLNFGANMKLLSLQSYSSENTQFQISF